MHLRYMGKALTKRFDISVKKASHLLIVGSVSVVCDVIVITTVISVIAADSLLAV